MFAVRLQLRSHMVIAIVRLLLPLPLPLQSLLFVVPLLVPLPLQSALYSLVLHSSLFSHFSLAPR